MENERLRDLPMFKKAREDVAKVAALKAILPLMQASGPDVSDISDAIAKVEVQGQILEEQVAAMDAFNELFVTRGWIVYEILDSNVIRSALTKASDGNFDGAEADLLAFYSPDKIDSLLQTMVAVKLFHKRMELAKKAARDYREGRYYASTMVILALIDGWVSEISENRRGFAAKDVDLTAWNSVAGHSTGLSALVRIFQTSRQTVRTEAIPLPYRHGIMHGMDLGFDNQLVAAKTWAALFAVREWAIKAARGELVPPPEETPRLVQDEAQALVETLADIAKTRAWTGRNIVPGQHIPISGKPEEYEEGSPERALVAFLNFWQKKNYGKMALFLQFIDNTMHGNRLPLRIRKHYSDKILRSYEILEIPTDEAGVAAITTKLEYERNDKVVVQEMRFVLESEGSDGKRTNRWNQGQKWVIFDPYV